MLLKLWTPDRTIQGWRIWGW